MSILERDLRCKILEAALSYAADWTVFPARPDKRGSYKSAERSGGRAWGATSDPDEIRRDFNRWPDAGIGVPTGTVNGIVLVEYDTVVGHCVDGAAALEDLQDRHGRLPTPWQRLQHRDRFIATFATPAAASRSNVPTRSLVAALM
jgi:hypothetical protein